MKGGPQDASLQLSQVPPPQSYTHHIFRSQSCYKQALRVHIYQRIVSKISIANRHKRSLSCVQIPGAMYPKVPTITVWLEESGSSNRAAPKSATNPSSSEFKRMLLVDMSL
ncbi:hypothetical protein HanPSC8_Chr03g0117661 [Helianthus annuus]|nr:hypothetical protein HanPSC8_Chr03g0117661 [Helianthus annuus]